MNSEALIIKDLQTHWHTCSQMKDYETFPPILVTRASGSYIELSNGRKIIDAISSWWCKSLGHQHPHLKRALLTQAEQFEHVISANTTNEIIVNLSQELTHLMPHLQKVFYASDGSSAVEIALKMSLHTRVIEGKSKKNRFIALKNSYHGETIGTLSISDIGIYREPYRSVLFDTQFIDVPYVSGKNDPKWNDASEQWHKIKEMLEKHAESTSAIIVEPILQGAGGMKIYSKDFLHRLSLWAKEHNIHLIADEIMTGIGRTGKMLASEHANIQPDFICLSKGLTSGYLPLSAVLTTDEIYMHFYDDYETGKSFLHSHTHSGNALAASVALATLKVIKQESLCQRANTLHNIMMQHLEEIAEQTGLLKNLRGIGAVVAADLIVPDQKTRWGYKVFQEGVKLGALIRPLGNTLYWFPPLNIEEETLSHLKDITQKALLATLEKSRLK